MPTDVTKNPYNLGNGQNDPATTLQQAINDVASGTAGTDGNLLINGGPYLISTPITVPSTITLLGNGILQAAPGLNDYILKFVPLPGGGITVVMRDLTLNHDGANQTAGGCVWAAGAMHSIFDHVSFLNPYDVGLFLDMIPSGANGLDNHVNRCIFSGGAVSAGAGQGLRIATSDKNDIAYNTFSNNGGAGASNYHVLDSSNYNVFEVNKFATGHEGIRLNGGNGSRVLGNTFDNLGRGCVHSTGAFGNISNNVMLGGCTDAANTYSHIELEGARNTIHGNYQSSGAVNGQLRSFYREWTSAADRNVVTSNPYDVSGATMGTALIEHLGPATKFTNNPGYNPVGNSVTPPVTTPTTNTNYTNTTGVNCLVFVARSGGTGSFTVTAIGGVSTGISTGVFYVPVGQIIAFAGTGGATGMTWIWFGD